MRRVYLDHNATTPVDPRVREAMRPALEEGFGNPSSVHAEGRRARDLVERARAEVAALVGGAPGEIVFTSGGTEADALGVIGGARVGRGVGQPARVVTSPLEHPAVLGATGVLAGEGFDVVEVPIDGAGRIDEGGVARACAAGGGVALAVFALANHELGNRYDVAVLAQAARAAGAGWVHSDAVQAAGKIAIDVRALGVDSLAISAHKLGGPKGVGALWVRRGSELGPLARGGHQERGLRGGTENVPGIVGFGEAARIARAEGLAAAAGVEARRDRFEAAARVLGARVHGDSGARRRVGNTSNLAWEGVSGELLVISLDLEGVACSTGAACTSGRVEASPVIRALESAQWGTGEGGALVRRASEAVRFSFGVSTSDEDVEQVLALLPALIARIRSATG